MPKAPRRRRTTRSTTAKPTAKPRAPRRSTRGTPTSSQASESASASSTTTASLGVSPPLLANAGTAPVTSMSLEQLMDVVGIRVRQEMQAYGPGPPAVQSTQANEIATTSEKF